MPEIGREVRMVREWAVTLPPRGSKDWSELVAVMFNRQDISDAFWSDDLVVSALVSEAEVNQNGQYPGYKYLGEDGELHFKVLATVRQVVPDTGPIMFSAQHYKVALEAVEPHP